MERRKLLRRMGISAGISRSLDWSLLGDSAVMSVGMAVARGLGFAFFLVLARAFDPAGYGLVQYGISVAGVVAILTMPFGQHVLARFVGKHHADSAHVERIVTNALLVLGGLFVLTVVLTLPAMRLLEAFDPGVLLIFLGFTIFYTYWGLARGFMAPVRLVIAYLASNAVQVVATLVIIQALGIRSTFLALAIYGLSYLLPLAVLQLVEPFPVRFRPALIDRGTIRDLLGFSLPIWLSHAGYILYTSVDVLMLERFASDETLGVYTLAKTLSMVFYFIPGGISTILMPKVAASPGRSHRRLVGTMLAVSLAINAVLFVGYVLLGEWFVRTLFGADYVFDPAVAILMAVGMIIFGAHSVVTAALVGSDRPRDETVSRVLAVIATTGIGLWLIPGQGALGAAIAVLAGAVVALATYGVMFAAQRPAQPAPQEEGQPSS
ncbi:MAG: oligosaccharide flippase family protein [Aggregatilineales bacterium]